MTVSGKQGSPADTSAIAPELRGTVDFLEGLLSCSPEAVIVIDCDGLVSYANPASERMLGRRICELIGSRVDDFVIAHETTASTRCDDGVLRGEAEIKRADGDTRWASVAASPLRLPDRRRMGAVAFLRDETDRRHAERRLSRKNDELENAVRAVSHDLRSPLVSVLGFSRLLREELGEQLGDQGDHFLERIEQAGRTMEGLIREMLDFSRIGHPCERSTLVDPREVLQQLRGELKPRLDEQAVVLGLPTEPPLLNCDRTRLYQIFSNLIGNALDHMGTCESARIDVEIAADGDWHHILVRDNGRGVQVEPPERIFEMFETFPRPDGTRGTGIGLATVKKIAEMHGGRAVVDSSPGQGAAFQVSLPRP